MGHQRLYILDMLLRSAKLACVGQIGTNVDHLKTPVGSLEDSIDPKNLMQKVLKATRLLWW
jgi:hypothetical protein